MSRRGRQEQQVSKSVQAAAAERFAPELVDEVMAVLSLYGVLPYEVERARVQFAILRLSEGDLSKLYHYADAATQDYRDVLYWAEYSHMPA
jgi:hypothetical protein